MGIQKLIERLQAEIGKLDLIRDALETQAATTTPEPEPAVDFDDAIERAEAQEARL